jgi:hypothetical protein
MPLATGSGKLDLDKDSERSISQQSYCQRGNLKARSPVQIGELVEIA